MADGSQAAADRVAEWHARRALNVGGSEIASLFYAWNYAGRTIYLHMFEAAPAGAEMVGCLSRHTTGYRLWHQKVGALPADSLLGERIAAGVHLESGIAEWAKSSEYEPGWGMKIRKVRRYIRHPSVEGMGCSRDYEEIAAGYPPVELKNVDGLIFRDFWACEGREITAPPLDITLQLQHQIACDGARADYGWIIACVSGNKLMRGQIARHAPTIARIEGAVAAFWQSIRAGQPPPDIADYDTIADVTATGAKGQTVDLSADAEMPVLCRHLARNGRLKKLVDSRHDRLKAQIGHRMGEADRATTAGWQVTWPQVNGRSGPYRGGMRVTPTTDYQPSGPVRVMPRTATPHPIDLATAAPPF